MPSSDASAPSSDGRRPARTRAELSLLAAEIGLRRYGRRPLTTVSIQHDEWCPLLAGEPFCVCEPEFVFEPIAVRP